MGFYKLPDTLDKDIETFETQIKDYQDEKISPVQFKGIRVAHGIYEQRKPQTHMVRIRCGACGIMPKQLKKVAQLAAQYSSGEIHVTTRGEIQLHYVDLKDVITVYRELTTVGLASRGGGGNTIRNIMASADSGIAKDEVFDVQPYATALTTRMLAEADSWNLPRKFKITFSNSSQDDTRATLTCLGFVAKMQDGKRGFKVYCAGGMGSNPMLGHVLYDFVPDDRVYYIAKAMKLMFDKYGNRRMRAKAKLKFLWEKLGEEGFREKFNQALEPLEKDPTLPLVLEPLENRSEVRVGYAPEPVAEQERAAFETWKQRYVTEQRQAGLKFIDVPLKLGDIQGPDAIKLADTLENFGENVMRFSLNQNLVIRNIPEAYLPNIFHVVMEIDSLAHDPALFGNMIACTGADTCKLGICLPRGVTPEIQKILRESDLDLDLLNDVKIHISGCPNTCGCHHVADLGFFGKVLRSGKEMLPGYNVLAGAIVEDGKTRFTEQIDTVAAKHLPLFVRDFLMIYSGKKQAYASFSEYIDRDGKEDIKRVCERYRELPTLEEDKSFFYDWGSDEIFSLLKGQKAECSAGMFDMIGVDARTIKEAAKQLEAAESDAAREQCIETMLFSACRMLLVTRGVESRDKEAVYGNFHQHFIKTDLVSERFSELVLAARARAVKDESASLLDRREEVVALADVMKKLYSSMDDSLRFAAIERTEEQKKEAAVSASQETAEPSGRFKDLRGVACPMNFVKTKLELATMSVGQKLVVFLDDGEAIENVPNSVRAENHKILEQTRVNGYWNVVIEKGAR